MGEWRRTEYVSQGTVLPPVVGADVEPASSLSVPPTVDALHELRTLDLSGARLLASVIAGWRILVVCSLMGAALGYGWSLRAAPMTYTAEVLLVPRVARVDVQFEPSIRTVTEVSNTPNGTIGVLTPERRQALVDLILGGSIERGAAQRLANVLPASELAPGVLAAHVRAGVKPRSEVIFVDASASSAADAVAIANAWADVYITQTNQLYADADSGATLQDLVSQRDAAKQRLDAAEAALANDLSSSRSEELRITIADRQGQLDLLVAPAEAITRNNQDTQAASNDYRLAELRTLNDLAQTLQRIDTVSQSLKGLLSDSATSTDPSSAPALALVKVQLVAIAASVPSDLQIQLPIPRTTTVTTADLQQLQASLARAHQTVAQELTRRRAAYEADRQQRITALNTELQQLRSDLEAATATRQELTAARDLAQSIYGALARKTEEVRIAQVDLGQEVQIASPATVATPMPTLPRAVLVAAGAVIALAFALGALVVRAGIRGWQSGPNAAGLAESVT